MFFLLRPLSFFFSSHLLLYLSAFASWPGPFQARSALRDQLSSREGVENRGSPAEPAMHGSSGCRDLCQQVEGPLRDAHPLQHGPKVFQKQFLRIFQVSKYLQLTTLGNPISGRKNKVSKQSLPSMKWCSRSKEKFLLFSDTCNVSKQPYLFYFL